MSNQISQGNRAEVNTNYVKHSFFVNERGATLRLNLSFSVPNWMMLLVWDPHNHLRAQYLKINEENIELFLSPDGSECSYSIVPGEMTIGQWEIEIFSSVDQYSLQVEVELGQHVVHSEHKQGWVKAINQKDSFFRLNNYHYQKVVNKEAGWYKGDFHTHTTISDGKLTPLQGMNQAKLQNLDFFVATDHNVVPTNWIEDDILVIPGVEITATKGHYNALGINRWLDWRPTCSDGGMESEEGMNRLLRETKEAQGIRSINHPMLKPWDWQFQKTALTEIDVVEIWNDPTYQDNAQATEDALTLWDELLLDGYHIYGIGGSDSHMLPTESYQEGGAPSLIGDPATYVFAEQLTAQSVLEALGRGEIYVSRGPELEIEMEDENGPVKLGSTCTGTQLHYKIICHNVTECSKVNWIVNGEVVVSKQMADNSIIEETFHLDSSYSYVRAEIRKEDGELLAFTNPIFKGTKEQNLSNWGELLQKAGK
ncbi:CehA/McbA family metallohydrolase [Gracilibacillus saliphilus]|uniref:CehA/McbA family metallohydrolase n=1 Tax=Gracilibacillus saliphilus TaxID=543890 RepID=UPI0013D19C93|nr:CehA/McbA family metallohydrolase [Gracilibacillus saliphilus]